MLALQICAGMLAVTMACYGLGHLLGKSKERKFLAYADQLAKESSVTKIESARGGKEI